MMSYAISILDQTPVFPNETVEQAFQHTIRLAQQAEQWGYRRFWLAEHHAMHEVAGSSPEILLAHLLAHTTKIRLGTGGVMLNHYSPFKVAENFNVLATLAPNRIDLGVGKSPGGFALSTKALQCVSEGFAPNFEQKLQTLQQFIYQQPTGEYATLQASPIPQHPPTMYVLGGSVESATLAASLKINYVFARFLHSDEALLATCAKAYKKQYPEGEFIVAVTTVAADTQQQALALRQYFNLFHIHFVNGKRAIVQSEDQIKTLRQQTTEPFHVIAKEMAVIAGTAQQVHAELQRLHQAYSIDEFILHTPLRLLKERTHSFSLLGRYKQ